MKLRGFIAGSRARAPQVFRKSRCVGVKQLPCILLDAGFRNIPYSRFRERGTSALPLDQRQLHLGDCLGQPGAEAQF